MNKFAFLALMVGLAACSDGSKKTVILVDAPPEQGVCNPIMQTGCADGQKCNWIYDQVETDANPDQVRVGHIGCEPIPASPVGLDQKCSNDPDGSPPVGADPCGKGQECVSGYCRTICDNQAAGNVAGTCDGDHACVNYQTLFVSGSATVAGVCNVLCDPWTQKAKIGANADACGSPSLTAPTRGCYGVEKFSCSRVAPFDAANHKLPNSEALKLTDRATPAGNYSNACAPGYMGILRSEAGSMTAVCAGLCAALESDVTQPDVARLKGDGTVLAKYPTAAQPAAGEATCASGKRGSANSVCKFLWPFRVNETTFEVAMTDTIDTMGVCFSPQYYTWDSNHDGTTVQMLGGLDDNQSTAPACNTLPKRTAATNASYDDAMDFLCQKIPPAFKGNKKSGTINVRKLMEGTVLPFTLIDDGSPLPMVRHQFN